MGGTIPGVGNTLKGMRPLAERVVGTMLLREKFDHTSLRLRFTTVENGVYGVSTSYMCCNRMRQR